MDMPALQAEAKIGQYLNEAHATEQALILTLQAHIAMTPAGSYREALEEHLEETREHSRLVAERLRASAPTRNPFRLGIWAAQVGLGLAESMTGRLLALGKAPIDMVRGSSGEEKLLKNAKDECASEALEIATYDALERVAEAVGDTETARLARRIRGDEERMLARVRREIPALAARVVESEVEGRPSYRADRTGSADAARRATRRAARAGRRAARAGAERMEVAGEGGARASRAAGRRASRATRAAAEKATEAVDATAAGAAAAAERTASTPAPAEAPPAGRQAARRTRAPRRRASGEDAQGDR
jgi:ferritin-like metal-binding protein YciE